jgi:glycerol-3-phosphate dehydrogenase (NAD(P)+)
MSPGDPSSPSRSRLAVVGGGAWGSVLAALLAGRGHEVRLWTRDRDRAERWAASGRDPAGRCPASAAPAVRAEPDLAATVADAEGLFLAVPNAALDGVLAALAACAPPGALPVSCSKGLLAPDLTRPSALIARALGDEAAVLSGPNLASEIAAGLPAAATAAAREPHRARRLQEWLNGPRFRVYVDDDPIGVEAAGAYKNVIALAAGMADALALGDNAKGALIARGLAETVRIGRHLGGRTRTFYGLAGVGDLVATCTSGASRNRRAGARLAGGETAEALLASGLTAEGLGTVRAVVAYADRHGLRLPIARQVHAVAFEGRPADDALAVLLAGDPGEEWGGPPG